jgi:hypothetical protein
MFLEDKSQQLWRQLGNNSNCCHKVATILPLGPDEHSGPRVVAHQRLDASVAMFHVCSHGSRDARRSEKPWLEGAYALRQRLPARDALHAPVRLPQAAGP